MKSKILNLSKMILLAPLSLFFGTIGGAPDSGKDKDKDAVDDDKDDLPKTYTTAEIKKMMAAEKEQGRRSVLKQIGVEKAEDAVNDLSEYAKIIESNKTDIQKAEDAKKAAEANAAKIAADLQATQFSLIALKAGVVSSKVDDAVILAKSKITDSTTFEQAIDQIKKDYPMFFAEDVAGADKGTGFAFQKLMGGKDNDQSLGARLGKSNASSAEKNPYFNKT